MNVKNLTPLSKRTKKEQREIAMKGGIASGEARRNKRDLRDKYRIMLELLANKALKKASVEEKILIKECGYEGYRLAKIFENSKSNPKVIMKVIEMVTDRIEGKPAKQINIETEDRITSIKLINGKKIITLKQL